MRKIWQYVPTVEERCKEECHNCTIELPVNESRVWCPVASEEGRFCQMKKDLRGNVQFARPWVEQYNPSAGRVIRTKQQLEEHFNKQSDVQSERMGFEVDLQIADLNDTKTLKVTEAGLDTTHNVAVKEGRKESKGKFVF